MATKYIDCPYFKNVKYDVEVCKKFFTDPHRPFCHKCKHFYKEEAIEDRRRNKKAVPKRNRKTDHAGNEPNKKGRAKSSKKRAVRKTKKSKGV